MATRAGVRSVRACVRACVQWQIRCGGDPRRCVENGDGASAEDGTAVCGVSRAYSASVLGGRPDYGPEQRKGGGCMRCVCGRGGLASRTSQEDRPVAER
jgi:hypothetical protein